MLERTDHSMFDTSIDVEHLLLQYCSFQALTGDLQIIDIDSAEFPKYFERLSQTNIAANAIHIFRGQRQQIFTEMKSNLFECLQEVGSSNSSPKV
jgi:hypothetical protein